jgi:hypothetical protein
MINRVNRRREASCRVLVVVATQPKQMASATRLMRTCADRFTPFFPSVFSYHPHPNDTREDPSDGVRRCIIVTSDFHLGQVNVLHELSQEITSRSFDYAFIVDVHRLASDP